MFDVMRFRDRRLFFQSLTRVASSTCHFPAVAHVAECFTGRAAAAHAQIVQLQAAVGVHVQTLLVLQLPGHSSLITWVALLCCCFCR